MRITKGTAGTVRNGFCMCTNDNARVPFVKPGAAPHCQPSTGRRADCGQAEGGLPRFVKAGAQTAMLKEKQHMIHGEAAMTVLFIALGTLAAVWLIVIVGSPMFGSDH